MSSDQSEDKPIADKSSGALAALEAVASNARRLAADAKFLREQGRCPASVVSAIIAIEEVAKYHVLRWQAEDPEYSPPKHRKLSRHTDKHAAFGAAFRARTTMQAMIKACKHFAGAEWETCPGETDWEKVQEFVWEGFSVSQHDPNPARRERAVEILNVIAHYIELSVDHDPLACLMSLGDDGSIDKQKQNALYADVDQDGLIKNDPASVTAGQAEFWTDISDVAIASLGSIEEGEAAAEAFTKRYKVVPPARSPGRVYTSEDWRKLFDRLSGADRK